jgi:pimeloyl-ACP methyl ester carboxylesterase
MDEEQIDTAVIAGHSMGGYTAMAFADLYPERLAGLSMVHSSAGADTEEKKETRRKSVELIRKGGKEPFVRQMVPALFADEFRTGNPGAVQQQVTSGLEMKPGNMIAFYNAMMNRPDRIAILSKVDFPVQWIIGREDKIASPETVLPQSRLAIVNFVSVYNGCGHMSMLEKPDRLVKDLADFSKYCFGVSR